MNDLSLSSNSSLSLCYQDLIDSGKPLSYWAELCSLSKITNWKSRGIPKKYQIILSKIISNNLDAQPIDEESRLTVIYQDLVDSEKSLSYFANLCGLSHVKDWKNRGIPECYQYKLSREIFSDKYAPISENVPTYATDDYFIYEDEYFENNFKNSTLKKKSRKRSPLVIYCEMSGRSIKNIFFNLRPFSLPEIDLNDKKKVFDDGKTKRYISNDGSFYEFVKKGKKWFYSFPDGFFIFDRFSLQATSRILLPNERVNNCLRASTGADIPIHKSYEHGATFFSNLQTCGSIWHCPACAQKISERRRKEVKQAIDSHILDGSYISFCTRTTPHTSIDELYGNLMQWRSAEVKFKGTRAYKKIMIDFGIMGTIKIYEITTTNNGWHLHVHELYFHNKTDFITESADWRSGHEGLADRLLSEWQTAAVNAGFKRPSDEHGLQVQNGDFAAAYIAKWGKDPESLWGVDNELSKSHIKKSFKGLSPFDLLRQFRDTGEEFYGVLFQEYAEVMKGQRQMIWSRGLKDYFDINDLLDEELAGEIEETAYILGKVSLKQWRLVLRYDYRALLLVLAKTGGWEAVETFLKEKLGDKK